MYTALKTGLSTCGDNWPSYESSGHFEAAQFYSITEHSLAPEIMRSEEIWDTSSPMTRRSSAGGEGSVPYMRKLWDEREEKIAQDRRGRRSQIVTVDKKPFQDAMKPVYDKFIPIPA